MPDPYDSKAVYIHAINHLANEPGASPPARSQVEIFRHVLNSNEATYIRSVRHPLIRTPNDLYSIAPGEFFVTNDHTHRSGLLRTYEDIMAGAYAIWTDTVSVVAEMPSTEVGEALRRPSIGPDQGIIAGVALRKIQNNNGLGHGATRDEILVASAAGGLFYTAKTKQGNTRQLELIGEPLVFNTALDNPTYFSDPYPTVGGDASGYVLAGQLNGGQYAVQIKNDSATLPSIVHFVGRDHDKRWKRHVLFQDDGRELNTASTAVLTAIDPSKNGGKKEAWLWATGPSSRAIVASRISLDGLY